MATHSSTLAWKISWMEEPGKLQSCGPQRVGHDWTTSLSFFLLKSNEWPALGHLWLGFGEVKAYRCRQVGMGDWIQDHNRLVSGQLKSRQGEAMGRGPRLWSLDLSGFHSRPRGPTCQVTLSELESQASSHWAPGLVRDPHPSRLPVPCGAPLVPASARVPAHSGWWPLCCSSSAAGPPSFVLHFLSPLALPFFCLNPQTAICKGDKPP